MTVGSRKTNNEDLKSINCCRSAVIFRKQRLVCHFGCCSYNTETLVEDATCTVNSTISASLYFTEGRTANTGTEPKIQLGLEGL